VGKLLTEVFLAALQREGSLPSLPLPLGLSWIIDMCIYSFNTLIQRDVDGEVSNNRLVTQERFVCRRALGITSKLNVEGRFFVLLPLNTNEKTCLIQHDSEEPHCCGVCQMCVCLCVRRVEFPFKLLSLDKLANYKTCAVLHYSI